MRLEGSLPVEGEKTPVSVTEPRGPNDGTRPGQTAQSGDATVERRQYSALFDTSLEGFLITDAGAEILEANDAACDLFGTTRECLVGRSLVSFLHEEERGDLLLRAARMVEGEIVPDWEVRLLPVGAPPLPARVTLGTAQTRAGRFLGLRWLIEDITELREKEQERARMVAAVEHAAESIVVTDPEGTIQYVNPAFERVSGYRRDEAVGEPDRILVARGERDEGTHRRMRESLARGEVWRGRFSKLRKDGTPYVVDSTVTPVRDASGGITGQVAVERDITEHLALAAKVQHAQKLESLGVLAGGIAHDFNNFLMGILGNADLALNHLPGDGRSRPYVERIAKAALRASDLTNQLLAYAGKGRFEIRPLRLNGLVEEMAHLLETVTSKKSSIRFELSDDLSPVEADESQVRQVVMNLITNASEALEGEPGAIEIATREQVVDQDFLADCWMQEEIPEGRYVCLEVSDTGVGMDAETRQKIFDPFFTTKFAGRGLGLAAVLGIVHAHRGAIRVRSRVGGGTTFTVLLPRSDREPSAEKPDLSAGRDGSGSVVLVVDDDEAVRSVTAAMLEAGGFRVLTAGDGRQGLEVFRAHRKEISIVLLDMTMPRMGGEETLREMKKARSDVRVILSSGYPEQEAAGRLAETGTVAFIQKPYRSTALLAKIGEVLARPNRPGLPPGQQRGRPAPGRGGGMMP